MGLHKLTHVRTIPMPPRATLRARCGAPFGVGPALALLALAGASASLTGCAKTVIAEPPAPAYAPPEPVPPVLRAVTERIGGGSTIAVAQEPTVLSRQRFDSARPVAVAGNAEGAPAAEQTIRVQYAAKSAEIGDVLRILIKDYLEQDFVLDPRVAGQISLEIDQELSRREIGELVNLLVATLNLTLEQRDGITIIRPGTALPRVAGAPVLDARPAFLSEQPTVFVRRLRHAPAEQVATMLRDLASESGKVLVAGRVLVLADTSRQVSRLARLADTVDVPAFEGVEVWTYRLSNRRPDDAARILDQIAQGTAINAATEPQVGFVAMPGTRRLMVIAKDPSLQPLIYDLIREVDQPTDSERRERYVYRVQHYPQAQLVKLLQDFFGDRMEAGTGGSAAAGTPASAEGRIRVVSDPQGDLVLIYATPSDYAEVLATLRTVDRPPQQVKLQSIIAEVRLTDALEWGVEYFLENNTSLGSLELIGTAPIAASSVATGSAFFIGGSGFALINALDRETSTRILSQPSITVADRAKGSIQVGGEVPVIRASEGSATQQAGTTGIRQEIEYRDTGVILDLEPQINETGTITLKITQDVRDSIATTIPNQPEFTTRKIETTVIVPHGRTVVLGGIINEAERNSADRIPLVGRVPVLGEAFTNRENTKQRTELLLAITPTIVNDPVELARLSSQFVQSIVGIRALMHELATDLPIGALHDLAAPKPQNPEVGPPPPPVDLVPANPGPGAAAPAAPASEAAG